MVIIMGHRLETEDVLAFGVGLQSSRRSRRITGTNIVQSSACHPQSFLASTRADWAGNERMEAESMSFYEVLRLKIPNQLD